jgi:hypothetical protein
MRLHGQIMDLPVEYETRLFLRTLKVSRTKLGLNILSKPPR